MRPLLLCDSSASDRLLQGKGVPYITCHINLQNLCPHVVMCHLSWLRVCSIFSHRALHALLGPSVSSNTPVCTNKVGETVRREGGGRIGEKKGGGNRQESSGGGGGREGGRGEEGKERGIGTIVNTPTLTQWYRTHCLTCVFTHLVISNNGLQRCHWKYLSVETDEHTDRTNHFHFPDSNHNQWSKTLNLSHSLYSM